MFNSTERGVGSTERSGGESRPGGSSRLSRSQIMDRILSMNPSATQAFLGRFSDSALGVYLDHLVSAGRPRGRDARWERPGDSPAIMASRHGR